MSEKLDLAPDERVEFVFKRADIFLLTTWIGIVVACLAISWAVVMINANGGLNLMSISTSGFSWLFGLAAVAVYVVIIGVGIISTKVHFSNRLFITNKRAIEYRASNLFAHSTNIIDLKSIEDVSFKQSGFLEHILGVGTLRMSTVGDETTYTFVRTKALAPSDLKKLSALVTSAKEGNGK